MYNTCAHTHTHTHTHTKGGKRQTRCVQKKNKLKIYLLIQLQPSDVSLGVSVLKTKVPHLPKANRLDNLIKKHCVMRHFKKDMHSIQTSITCLIVPHMV